VKVKNAQIKPLHKPRNVSTNDLVLCGFNHPAIITQYTATTGSVIAKDFKIGVGRIDGFLTNKNRFLNRKDSVAIAKESGQLNEIIGGELTSEDLWGWSGQD
jgi:hypothetical protein